MIDRQYIEDILIGLGVDKEQIVLEVPTDNALGDWAYPCFRLAKMYRKAPQAIAIELASRVSDVALRAVAQGGYLNFFVDRDMFVRKTIIQLRARGHIGTQDGVGRTVCVEYSSVNIAKPFHIGHLMSTAIGGALYRMYSYLGYNVVGINHLGDWGTQFGKLLYAYQQWGDEHALTASGIDYLQSLYVRYHQEVETDSTLDDHARAWSLKIERGDALAQKTFAKFKRITLDEVGRIYRRLGVHFDSYDGESFYQDKIGAVVQRLQQLSLLEHDEGAQVVRMDSGPPCLVLRSDGASLYATRDLAAAIYRKATYGFEKCLYIVAYQQNLHFKQVFGVLAKMGYAWASDCIHVSFGMVSLQDGTLSSRKGRVLLLDSVLDDAVDKAMQVIVQKNPQLENQQAVAEAVGVGAVIFGVLSSGRINDVVFDIDKALQFDGETGPYLQYTHARCCSIVARAKLQAQSQDMYQVDEDSYQLVRLLSGFDDAVRVAAYKYEPSMLVRLLLDIAQAFNKFYISNRILSEGGVSQVRLEIVQLTAAALKAGLDLILLKAPEKM